MSASTLTGTSPRLAYQSGFRNEFATEALPGALPVGRNSPQRCAYGLYAEQLTGRAFTAPRGANLSSWLYRIRPAAMHLPFEPMNAGSIVSDFAAVPAPPDQLRWNPFGMPAEPTDFIDGPDRRWPATATRTRRPAPPATSTLANRSMTNRAFYDADGELLIVLQHGRQRFVTELGVIEAGAAGDRGDPPRRALSRRADRRQCPRLRVRELRRAIQAAGPRAPSAPTAWPTRATSSHRWRLTRTSTATSSWWPSSWAICGAARMDHSPFDVVAVARQLRALQVRPAPLQRHRLDHLRPPRSIDLPGAALGRATRRA